MAVCKLIRNYVLGILKSRKHNEEQIPSVLSFTLTKRDRRESGDYSYMHGGLLQPTLEHGLSLFFSPRRETEWGRGRMDVRDRLVTVLFVLCATIAKARRFTCNVYTIKRISI